MNFLGELALSGELRPVKGALPAALAAKQAGRCLIVPDGNGDQVALVGRETHKSAPDLLAVCGLLCGQRQLELCCRDDAGHAGPQPESGRDMQDIIG